VRPRCGDVSAHGQLAEPADHLQNLRRAVRLRDRRIELDEPPGPPARVAAHSWRKPPTSSASVHDGTSLSRSPCFEVVNPTSPAYRFALGAGAWCRTPGQLGAWHSHPHPRGW